jgi:uncharacterized coiled-coil DUF342 family protein
VIASMNCATMFNETEHLIKEMFENIGKIRQNRETNSSSVKEQKRIIQDEIQELRTKVNNHLDKLQENLMKELTELEKQVTFNNYFGKLLNAGGNILQTGVYLVC